jgi:rhodanese-related sulfurtransferase
MIPLAVEKIRRLIAEQQGLLIDIREVDDYIAGHIRGSISNLWEAGTGFATRARDLLPLDSPLIMVEHPDLPTEDAAQQLRGKGFDVVGALAGGIEGWPEPSEVVATRVLEVDELPGDLFYLHVYDPGTQAPQSPFHIAVERLWERFGEISDYRRIGVLAGYGVRAAAAVGILERLGIPEVVFIRTRPAGDRPRMAGPEVFRVGGPG